MIKIIYDCKIAECNEKMNDLRNEHETEIERFKNEHKEEIDIIKSKHQNEISKMVFYFILFFIFLFTFDN